MTVNKFNHFFVFIVCLLLISSCRTAAVRNVDETEFALPSQASLADVKRAIIRGANKAGWKSKSIDSRSLLASYSYKRNRFGAVVKITYDNDSYDISYYSSHNLKYNEQIESETGEHSDELFRDSMDFFSENNPFKKDQDISSSATKPATIHKIYNKWLINLESKINFELAHLSRSIVKTKQTQIKQPQKEHLTTLSTCNTTPVFNDSGQGKTTRSSVNIRTGSSTRCAISNTISNYDEFTLLGKKGNWYYVSLDNGKKGWIYAPLVKRLETFTSQQALETNTSNVPQRETAQQVHSKNISIAVIRFKTLNKEAQDISLGELVSETFTSALVNSRKFKIIEREQLDKLVKEMEMTQTGFIESTDAVEIGKMLHADAIITGSVALLDNQIQLNARIIEIESSYVLSADTKTSSYTLKNINLIANEIVTKLARRLGN